jgi:hypothetical protein
MNDSVSILVALVLLVLVIRWLFGKKAMRMGNKLMVMILIS